MTDSKGFRLRGTEPFEAAVSSLFGSLRVTDPGPPGFQAVVDHVAIGALMVTRIQAAAATVTRDTRCITSTDVEWMHLTLHRCGQVAVTQDDRTTALKPGVLFACDNTRPYRIIGAEASEMTVLCVPRASLGKQADCMSRRTALPIPTQDGIGRLLGCALSGMEKDLPRQGVARTYLADALTTLVLAAFVDTTPEQASVASDLVDRIRVYVLAHLGDPLLSAERIARRHHISVRHLHALFKGYDLTFAAWVRHERLLRIRRDLLDPACADRSTAAIAARWGVLDTKHLGRALKREFGETVSDLRSGQQDGHR
ncbi:helix-turn-helix domain-containing protein [Streptomyces sp. DG2A-72]|uniref:AraC-like ligand-binding domain-containing protein n=1 Tax=Streptomyces sp. DG2A-72 TaxID=3051386 RepID=UPI00265BD274|nr:helix-turn-helix domain-containing protein [Streptomyces sp. DG2A-72]MDO0939149.1 helix-turn-helix domain-containing protein [Streptomyces sp. DG2A-72]